MTALGRRIWISVREDSRRGNRLAGNDDGDGDDERREKDEEVDNGDEEEREANGENGDEVEQTNLETKHEKE